MAKNEVYEIVRRSDWVDYCKTYDKCKCLPEGCRKGGEDIDGGIEPSHQLVITAAVLFKSRRLCPKYVQDSTGRFAFMKLKSERMSM